MKTPELPDYCITLKLEDNGCWLGVVSRASDGQIRFYHSDSVSELLDAKIAGFVEGYDE